MLPAPAEPRRASVPADKVHARQWGLGRSARMHGLSVGPM